MANCTMATHTAMTIASEKEMTVKGMVAVSPGRRIFQKESASRDQIREENTSVPPI